MRPSPAPPQLRRLALVELAASGAARPQSQASIERFFKYRMRGRLAAPEYCAPTGQDASEAALADAAERAEQLRGMEHKPADPAAAGPKTTPCGDLMPLAGLAAVSETGRNLAAAGLIEALLWAAEADIAAAAAAHAENTRRAAAYAAALAAATAAGAPPPPPPRAAPLARPVLPEGALPSLAALLPRIPALLLTALEDDEGGGGLFGRPTAAKRWQQPPSGADAAAVIKRGKRGAAAGAVGSYDLASPAGAAWWAAVREAAAPALRRLAAAGTGVDGGSAGSLSVPWLDAPLLKPARAAEGQPLAGGAVSAPAAHSSSSADLLPLPPLQAPDAKEVLTPVAALLVSASARNAPAAASALLPDAAVHQAPAGPGYALGGPFVPPPAASDSAAPLILLSLPADDTEGREILVHPLAAVARQWEDAPSADVAAAAAAAAAPAPASPSEAPPDAALAALAAFHGVSAADPVAAATCGRLLDAVARVEAAGAAAAGKASGRSRRLRILSLHAEAALRALSRGERAGAAAEVLAAALPGAIDAAVAIGDACAAASAAASARARALCSSLDGEVAAARAIGGSNSSAAAASAARVWDLLSSAGAVAGIPWPTLLGAALSTDGAAVVGAFEPLLPQPFVERRLLPAATHLMMLHANAAHAATAAASAGHVAAQLQAVAALLLPASSSANDTGSGGLGAAATLATHALAALASQVAARRSASCYVTPADPGSDGDAAAFSLRVPPQFAYAEFMLGSLLRPGQAELVSAFVAAVARGEPAVRVRQMLMGQGKTSVVVPLCVLLLADGRTLVSSVMPAPLVVQSADTLRALLQSPLLCRPLEPLGFDRSEGDLAQVGWVREGSLPDCLRPNLPPPSQSVDSFGCVSRYIPHELPTMAISAAVPACLQRRFAARLRAMYDAQLAASGSDSSGGSGSSAEADALRRANCDLVELAAVPRWLLADGMPTPLPARSLAQPPFDAVLAAARGAAPPGTPVVWAPHLLQAVAASHPLYKEHAPLASLVGLGERLGGAAEQGAVVVAAADAVKSLLLRSLDLRVAATRAAARADEEKRKKDKEAEAAAEGGFAQASRAGKAEAAFGSDVIGSLSLTAKATGFDPTRTSISASSVRTRMRAARRKGGMGLFGGTSQWDAAESEGPSAWAVSAAVDQTRHCMAASAALMRCISMMRGEAGAGGGESSHAAQPRLRSVALLDEVDSLLHPLRSEVRVCGRGEAAATSWPGNAAPPSST